MEKSIRIRVASSDKSTRGKRYKQFNNLLNNIDKLKQQLESLQEQMVSGITFFYQEIKPRHLEQQEVMVQLVKALHHAHSDELFGKKDREKISYLIKHYCRDLFEVEDQDFPELIEIFNFHSTQTHEEMVAEVKERERRQAEELIHSFGLTVDLDDEDDMDSIMAKAMAAAEQAKQEAAERSANRPQTERQKLKAEQERQKEKDIQKVSKNIYSELVRLLHPDQEQDETQRFIKTEAIQRVNDAYERNDLFELLSLQAEYVQKEGDHLTLLPDQEFKYYLKVLRNQQQELQEALFMMGHIPGVEGYVVRFLCHGNPSLVAKIRQDALAAEKKNLGALKENLKKAGSPQTIKKSLRYLNLEEESDYFDLYYS